MGCCASRSLPPVAPVAEGQENPNATEEHREQARAMFARIQVIPPLQRRRARSVGLPEDNGMYWVYWPPNREENGRRDRVESTVSNFLQEGRGRRN